MSGAKSRHIAVIGAGWAGCAAAVELAATGNQVTVFETARTAGGRARRVALDGRTLDNGQHILLGAYGETLRLLARVGIERKDAFLTLPLQMRYPPGSGMDFIAPRLPAPLHVAIALLRAKGLRRADKLALARFSSAARWMDWQLNVDCSVTELLERFDQTARLNALMWRPLCIAALNTPPERASAKVFLAVLRDSLGAKRAASDMLLPRVDLSALFPDAALRFVEQHGGTVRLGCQVEGIARGGADWTLALQDGSEAGFDGVVLATPPSVAARLALDYVAPFSFEYEPITTVYLQYAPELKLGAPFYALEDEPRRAHWGQFVFDRGALDAQQAGLFAVVVSASAQAIEMGREALAQAVARQLATVLGNVVFETPQWTQVITEKRATFSCAPGLARPANATSHEGLVLAGDYTAGEYPATLEMAVRSGVQAAKSIQLA